jgi:hypothetical protein
MIMQAEVSMERSQSEPRARTQKDRAGEVISPALIVRLRSMIGEELVRETFLDIFDKEARSFFDDCPRITRGSSVATEILRSALSRLGIAAGPSGYNELRVEILHEFGSLPYGVALTEYLECYGVEDFPNFIRGADFAIEYILPLVWPDRKADPPTMRLIRDVYPNKNARMQPLIRRHYDKVYLRRDRKTQEVEGALPIENQVRGNA